MQIINAVSLSESQRLDFLDGWQAAGGFMGDLDSPKSKGPAWCAPWNRGESIRVTGRDPRRWGAQHWNAVRNDVELEVLADDEAERIWEEEHRLS